MYEFKLDAKQCVSCGICVDVCKPRVMSMRRWNSRTVEGSALSYFALATKRNQEKLPVAMYAARRG